MGHAGLGVDSSAVGLKKAQSLAVEHSAKITTVVADLANYSIEPNGWDGVVSIKPLTNGDGFRGAIRRMDDCDSRTFGVSQIINRTHSDGPRR